jgi:L-threonylcarbamoyladenylate synthase
MITTNIEQAVATLQQEGLIGLPTETVYGLAGNMYSEKAVRQIFATKQRPLFNPLIVHIGRLEDIHQLAENIPPIALQLAERYWPGPLTLLLPKRTTVPDLITAGKPTVAIRMPNHPLALALLQSLPFPLVAPSANPFGRISPTTAQHVQGYFGDDLLVLDGGPCQKGIESTIVGFDEVGAIIYRMGTITPNQIESVAGKVRLFTQNDTAPEAPGMLAKHYSPATPSVFFTDLAEALERHPSKRIGLLLFNKALHHPAVAHQEVLSYNGSLEEAATNLYAALHRLDNAGLDLILIQALPDEGIGKALNDRLRRASA